MRFSLNGDWSLCIPSGGALWDGLPPGKNVMHLSLRVHYDENICDEDTGLCGKPCSIGTQGER